MCPTFAAAIEVLVQRSLVGHGFYYSFAITIRGVFHLILYPGSASDEQVREAVLGGLLCCFVRVLRALTSYSLRDHVTELLTEVWTGHFRQVCGASC